MTYKDVTEILGEPQELLTFGLMVVKYQLTDGFYLTVEYAMNLEGNYIVQKAEIFGGSHE